MPPRPSRSARTALRSYLEGLTGQQLIALIEELNDTSPEARTFLRDRLLFLQARHSELLDEARQAISGLDEGFEWQRGRRVTTGPEVDLPRLEKILRQLLSQGRYDELTELGHEFMTAAMRRLEAEDESESFPELQACMAVLFKALSRSSLSAPERIAWAVERSVEDGLGLCTKEAERVLAGRFTPAQWAEAAALLRRQLAALGSPPKKGSDPHLYERAQWIGHIGDALKRAGRLDDALELFREEASATGSHRRLVDELLAAGRKEEAERTMIQMAAREGADGAAMRDALLEYKAAGGDWHQVAALHVDRFLHEPTFRVYEEVRHTARMAGPEVWEVLSRHLSEYLIAGGNPKGKRDWPLPAPLVPVRLPYRPHCTFPVVDTLIDIALADGQTDELLRWHSSARSPGSRLDRVRDARVADALAANHPDYAIALWKRLAEAHIAEAQPAAYQAARPFLAKLRDRLRQAHRQEEWAAYLAGLRQTHRAKRRLLEVLAGLE